jgi:SNF2 family DNA or RNA helicase
MELMQHQIDDAAFLASKKFAGNFSGMGSGKTLTALEAIKLLNLNRNQRVLIVAPPIALHMWQEEYERHLGKKAVIVRKRDGTGVEQEAQALIMSYDIATHASGLKWLPSSLEVLICDESHALKSYKAKRTKAIIGSNGLCERAAHSWMLTGTPQTRWNDDMFPFLCRANHSGLRLKIGSVVMSKYLLRYCVSQEKSFGRGRPVRTVVGNRNTSELNELLFDVNNPLAIRRTLKSVWDAMPPITHSKLVIDVPISSELEGLMDTVDDGLFTGVRNMHRDDDSYEDGFAKKDPALATIRRLLGLAKVDAVVAEIYRRVDDGHGPILVGAWHTEVIDTIVVDLRQKGLRVASLDGRTSSRKKTETQDLFNNGKLDVLVGQIAAMGVSLNLQKGGNRIIVAEQDWSPAVMDQFYGRLHRMGQKKPVNVETIVSNTKIDKAIARIASTKASEHRKLIGSTT